MTNHKQIVELDIFAAVLVMQSLPFIAAGVIAAVEGLALQRVRLLARRRGQGGGDPAAPGCGGGSGTGQVPADNRVETAQ
jgi:hypothetical protein